MNLEQINELWTEYKERYELDSDIMIEGVAYDTPEFVEGCFDLIELMHGRYILHLTRRVHIYSESYIRFILFHEFTHFYDFIKSDFEEKQDLFLYMNSYSEYHACRIALGHFIDRLTLKTVHINKIQIPGPFKEISIRRLLEESLYRAKMGYDEFYAFYQPQDFVNCFRLLMYLFGYIALFKDQDEALVAQVLKVLRIKDDCYINLYHALKDQDIPLILDYCKECYECAFLMFLRDYIHKHYDPSLYDEDELESLTQDNYQEFLEDLDEQQQEMDDAQEEMESPIAAFIAGCLKANTTHKDLSEFHLDF